MRRLADDLGLPTYFVLGNHDYYHDSITEVRRQAAEIPQVSPLLKWLPAAGVVALGENAALVGHGGWGDGRAGDFLNSGIVLNDYVLVEELRRLQRRASDSRMFKKH